MQCFDEAHQRKQNEMNWTTPKRKTTQVKYNCSVYYFHDIWELTCAAPQLFHNV